MEGVSTGRSPRGSLYRGLHGGGEYREISKGKFVQGGLHGGGEYREISKGKFVQGGLHGGVSTGRSPKEEVGTVGSPRRRRLGISRGFP